MGDASQTTNVDSSGEPTPPDGDDVEAGRTRDGASRDGCGQCSDGDALSERDAALDALLVPDAEQEIDGSARKDSGPPLDAGSTCVSGQITCPLFALPCCTNAATPYYGTCAAPALCR